MPSYKGKCVCGNLQYTVSLYSPEEARTSLCHCHNCRRAFGTNFGLTIKVPVEGFEYSHGKPKVFKQDNGVTREFCETCGVFICEYGEQAANKFRYIMWGTFDDPEQFPPKGEFFCKYRTEWMPRCQACFTRKRLRNECRSSK